VVIGAFYFRICTFTRHLQGLSIISVTCGFKRHHFSDHFRNDGRRICILFGGWSAPVALIIFLIVNYMVGEGFFSKRSRPLD